MQLVGIQEGTSTRLFEDHGRMRRSDKAWCAQRDVAIVNVQARIIRISENSKGKQTKKHDKCRRTKECDRAGPVHRPHTTR